MLKALQLLPQHAREPVLFECKGLQSLELQWQIPGSDGGGQHVDHDAQLARRLQASVSAVRSQGQRLSHPRHRDGAMRLARRNLNTFEPRIEFRKRKAALCERCR